MLTSYIYPINSLKHRQMSLLVSGAVGLFTTAKEKCYAKKVLGIAASALTAASDMRSLVRMFHLAGTATSTLVTILDLE